MIELRDAGISKQQFLAVWDTNADNGFTPAQLLTAGITIAQMQARGITLSQIHAGGVSIAHLLGTGLSIAQLRTGGVPDYALFNEACNTPLSVGASPSPTIRLLSTNLTPTNTQVVLEGKGRGLIRWELTGITGSIDFDEGPINTTRTLGRATAVYLGVEDSSLHISTLSLPFDYVFSNLTVTNQNSQLRTTSIQLCPGR